MGLPGQDAQPAGSKEDGDKQTPNTQEDPSASESELSVAVSSDDTEDTPDAYVIEAGHILADFLTLRRQTAQQARAAS